MSGNYCYKEVINRIQNARRFGKLSGRETSERMLERLGNPQREIPFVHIAGTNGKGSTVAFLCSILEQTGKKVGMFTSPHLVHFEERIRINGKCIAKEDVARIGNQLLAMDFGVEPTMFDYCMCMAVLYYKEQDCDIMVMETGLGGRCDSTNALGTPVASVITKIGYDHVAILGDTLAQIAWEKAGIMKAGIPVVVQRQEDEAAEVLRREYDKVNSHITGRNAVGKCKAVNGVLGQFVQVREEDITEIVQFSMRMKGEYQLENAAAAMLAARLIIMEWRQANQLSALPCEPCGFEAWEENCIREGITRTIWKGRMELLNEEPFFMVDGAHNSHGVHALAESLRALYPNERFHFIMGVMADKDYDAMIEELLPLALDFVTVTPESTRALQASDLAACIQKKGVTASYVEDMEALIRPYLPRVTGKELSAAFQQNQEEPQTVLQASQRLKQQPSGEKTIAFGSLYFIGAIEALMESC